MVGEPDQQVALHCTDGGTGGLRASVVIDRNNLTVGTDARLMCRITDALGGEHVTIQWHKDGQMIDTDNEQDRYTFDGAYLNVEKVIGQDGGEYTCTAVRGDEEVQSPAVTLYIQREYLATLRMTLLTMQDA